MLAKRTSKNQITLPKEIIKEFEYFEYFDVTARGNEIILRPVSVQSADERLLKVRDKVRSLGLTEQDLQKAIQWARKSA